MVILTMKELVYLKNNKLKLRRALDSENEVDL